MLWREAQPREQQRAWAAVDRALDSLPPRLFRQAKLLEYDMALRWSATGQFRDIFLGIEAFPLTSIGRWLLDDLGAAPTPERDEAESHLLVTAVYLAARAHLIEAILDPSSFVRHEHVALIAAISERLMAELAAVVPPDAPFWELRTALAEDDLEAMLEDRERREAAATSAETPDDPFALLRPAWSSPARLLALAAMASHPAAATGRRETTEAEVGALLDALAEAVQIRDDLATMQRDLQDGRLSYPIALTARAAQLPMLPWPSSAVVLGAMIATGSLAAILDAATTRLLASRECAARARLPTFEGFLDDVIDSLDERRRGLTMTAVPSNAIHERSTRSRVGDSTVARPAPEPRHGPPTTPLVPTAEAALPKAMTMAEGFLLRDGALRESWEMHREGMFGAPEVWSRYPEGLVLEILADDGHDVTNEVDDLLAFNVTNGFRYFAHEWSAVDSDTVGVFLRLLTLATPNAAYQPALDAVLVRLADQVREAGAVPVWIARDAAQTADRPPAMDLGESCGTVAAHLLLGLIASGGTAYHDTVATGARHLLERIAAVGLAANVDYPPLYALARFDRLIQRLSRSTAADALADAADQARPVLATALDRARTRGPRSAQDAALLTIACIEAGRARDLDPAWRTTILKSQRFDGGWPGEPFAAAPNRGRSVTWYSSATLTTALCYDALRRGAFDQRRLRESPGDVTDLATPASRT